MKLLKPTWVNHNGKPIFAVDIHPDGTRFATAGQGDESGKIIVWNMAPVMEEEAEKNENIPKVLCHMDNHLACVNCIRWSNNGYYLASGSDDKLVMIWQKVSGSSTVFGSRKINVEQWRCSYTLRSHSGDILDVAWSPHDAWLASCSIDNSIVIWNALKFPEVITVLRGHSGMVKGVSWDPIGKYLASQGDDKSLRVWRTLDWKEETAIFKPFHECGGTTHVLRLSWSPDGSYLVSAHAMNNRGPTAQIVEREGWGTNMDFVGHRKAITCVRFSSNIYTKSLKKGSSKTQNYTMCAIGSRDKSVSVWMTALKRPLVVLHDLFQHSVMDISWSSSGKDLMACSWDGTIAYFQFSESEAGQCLTKEESRKVLEKMYGKGIIAANSQQASLANTIIESPAMLKFQQKQKMLAEQQAKKKQQQQAQVVTPVKMNKANPVVNGKPLDVKSQQIETRTPDGRRRITPLFIPPQAFDEGPPAPFNGSIGSPFKTAPVKEESPSDSDAISKKDKNEAEPKSRLDLRLTDKTKVQTEKERKISEVSHRESGTQKRKETTASQPTKKPRKEYTKRVTLTTTPLLTSLAVTERSVPPPKSSGSSQVHLPTPEVQKSFAVNFTFTDSSEDDEKSIEVENDVIIGATTFHKVKCLNRGQLIWETIIQSRGLNAAGNKYAVCVSCEDKTLHCFSAFGRRLLPPIILPAVVSHLHSNGHFVLALTTNGRMYVWDIKQSAATLKGVPLVPIMTGTSKPTLNRVTLTDKGVPVLTLSNSRSYTYNPNMVCWMLLDSSDNLLQQCSDHAQSYPTETSNESEGPLSQLQRLNWRSSLQAKNVFQTYPSLQKQSTLGHLENQLATAVTLKSSKEYKFWLLTYVRYLVQEVLEKRLREICEDLLGPVPRSETDSVEWQSSILGLCKTDLLEEVLLIVGSNLKLQRMYSEFQEQLDMVERL